MSRTAVYSALILKSGLSKFTSASHESSREIHLLTAEEGIVRATVFGGPKSKLRSHSAPYNSGQVWLYRNPAKDSCKLSDFDVHSWRPGLRELYERTMASGAVAETILATHGGGGSWDVALKIATDTLDALESASEELCSRLLVHFLWRWADFLGIQPPVDCCALCAGIAAANSALWFYSRENSVLCGNCVSRTAGAAAAAVAGAAGTASAVAAASAAGLLQLNSGCRRWLAATGQLEPSALHRYSMDRQSFREAKSLACAVITGALGKRLASWEW